MLQIFNGLLKISKIQNITDLKKKNASLNYLYIFDINTKGRHSKLVCVCVYIYNIYIIYIYIHILYIYI